MVDLRFGFKVAGGFTAILLLTAVVGGVGFLTINNLSSRFVVADHSAQVATQVQATSLKRENYLAAPSPSAAEAARTEIDGLTDALNALAGTVAGDTDAAAQVKRATDAVAEFSGTFDAVVAQTDQQNERLATLQESTANLKNLAVSISSDVATAVKKVSAEVFTRQTARLTMPTRP